MKKNGKKRSYIYLDKDTEFTGSIETSSAYLEGRVHGTILAHEDLKLVRGSKAEGYIFTSKLYVEEGASLNSKVFINDSIHALREFAKKQNQQKSNSDTADEGRSTQMVGMEQLIEEAEEEAV